MLQTISNLRVSNSISQTSTTACCSAWLGWNCFVPHSPISLIGKQSLLSERLIHHFWIRRQTIIFYENGAYKRKIYIWTEISVKSIIDGRAFCYAIKPFIMGFPLNLGEERQFKTLLCLISGVVWVFCRNFLFVVEFTLSMYSLHHLVKNCVCK